MKVSTPQPGGSTGIFLLRVELKIWYIDHFQEKDDIERIRQFNFGHIYLVQGNTFYYQDLFVKALVNRRTIHSVTHLLFGLPE